MPSIPSEFPELNDLTLDQLEKLESDPAELERYIESMTLVSRYTTMNAAETEKACCAARASMIDQESLNRTSVEIEAAIRLWRCCFRDQAQAAVQLS
jgi:hypothetical protein